ncbi:MAG: ABCB family ABC transporter ATP-binding protein/permease [Acidiferrobacteraceae bacterium]
MRPLLPSSEERKHGSLAAIKPIWPYLLEFRGRIAIAFTSLVLAKLANVSIPLILRQIVNSLTAGPKVLVLPLALLIAYGALRLFNSVFSELRDAVFAKVSQHAVRRAALEVFAHLHKLSLRFHLERQTGGVSRDIERGSRGISFLLNFMLFNILPTLVEIILVAVILLLKYSVWFAVVTFATLATYIMFTLVLTEWRMIFRRTMNDHDSKANTRAVDSLINYETVKYFGNEHQEITQYDHHLKAWEQAAVRNQVSLALLNVGQGAIIAVGVTILMVMAADGVVRGTMTIGDLVLVNAYLIQLYSPLHFLGFVYREIRNSLTDMERMFRLLDSAPEIHDCPGAKPIAVSGGALRFEHVDFCYQQDRQILFDVDFSVAPGAKVAIVGRSGSGKSTVGRLLFRFYDVTAGRILIDGQDVRNVTQRSLRSAIGVVPQDTVLFNDTVYHNIAYGRSDASRDEVVTAARHAHIHDFLSSLPLGYDTLVGERGLKLSGGEKQRVAIARTLLKRPHILVFDEATSALDSESEKSIQDALREIALNHTTLVIAHRLSTIVDADLILVMDSGRIVERGSHPELLARDGIYARLWAMQQREKDSGRFPEALAL